MPNYSLCIKEVIALTMDANKVLYYLPFGKIISKNSFRETVHSIYPDCSETSINWMLVTLHKQGFLVSRGAGKYYRPSLDTSMKKKYSYYH